MTRHEVKESTKLRVIAIYRMLQSGKHTTARQIMDDLRRHYDIECDRKTIYDDIAAIDRIMPIKSTQGRNGGYQRWDVVKECEP